LVLSPSLSSSSLTPLIRQSPSLLTEKLPFLPQFTIASGSGSYDKGVVLKFSLVVISGTFTFTIKSGWLWLHYDVKVLGREYKGDVKLIPVP